MSEPLDTVIVGAGISGLTTAFALHRAGRRVTVLESAQHVGGAITSSSADGWLCELGPNTVVENHPAVGTLLADAGIAGDKLVATPSAKRRFLWKGDRLHPLPAGPAGFLGTSLYSIGAKLRLLREPWIGRPESGTEETIGQFVRRRLGPEMLDYAVGPFVSGVYAGDPERLSVQHAVAKIYALERDHGSLVRGAMAKRKGPAPGGEMITFEAGLGHLPRRLAAAVGDVRTGWTCHGIERRNGLFEIVGSAATLRARHVVVTTPADVTARLLGPLTGGRAAAFAEIPYAPISIFSLGFRREDVAHPLDGFGFLAPRRESLRILGCLFPSSLFPGRAPAGHVLVTAFLGGRTDPAAAALEEHEAREVVLGDLRRALGLRADPVFAAFRRWPRGIPQYELGHGRFVELADELEHDIGGLYIGGNMLRGVSVPDCIRNGYAVAERVLAG